MKVEIINRSKHQLPAYETALSAGMDLRANIDEPIVLQPLERTAPQDEAGLTKTFQTWPRGWFHIP